jgi:pyridoxine 4-dehydrogenase
MTESQGTRTAATNPTFAIGGDIEVHRLAFGAMRITGRGIWGPPADREQALQVLRRAAQMGVDFIDTADAYGPHVSEELIHDALHPYDGIVIATKGGLTRSGPDRWEPNGNPDHLRRALDGSLQRLGVDVIELYQLHRIDSKVPREEQFGVLREFVDAGKVHRVGLSQVSVEEIEAARQIVPIASVQNLYNLADRASEDVLDHCEQNGIAFIPWFPIATGDLTKDGGTLGVIAEELRATPVQVALAWLLRRSPVMLPIPGTGSVEHLEENMGAANVSLTDAQFEALARLA